MENSAQSLYGLIFGCPLEDEKLKKACPLKKVWELKPIGRLDFVQNLNYDQKKELAEFHNNMECKNHIPKRISEGLQEKLDSIEVFKRIGI